MPSKACGFKQKRAFIFLYGTNDCRNIVGSFLLFLWLGWNLALTIVGNNRNCYLVSPKEVSAIWGGSWNLSPAGCPFISPGTEEITSHVEAGTYELPRVLGNGTTIWMTILRMLAYYVLCKWYKASHLE